MNQHKHWHIAETDSRRKRELSEALRVPEVIAGVLLNRGFDDRESAEKFLNAEKQAFIDPFLMKDMARAVKRIREAIARGEKIMVYGDYDVDGITATALLIRALSALGASVAHYIPERQSEGYGLNRDALDSIVSGGARLIVTVDCGIASVEEARAVLGRADLIVTDHHQPPEVLPEAYAIVNPKQKDCAYPDKNLAGVGVAYKLCQALWREIRGEEFTEYLEIAALGTIADVVPLLGENRLIVKRGLARMKDSRVCGLRCLIDGSGLADKKIDAGRVGFILAPRLNAAGRLSSALTGVSLLLTEDLEEAKALARRLEEGNLNRQIIEKEILKKAEELLLAVDAAREKVLVVAGEGWHTGVIGIVASRLVDRYYKPTVVIGVKDGVGKGSCRSIRGFDLFAALTKCGDLLEQYGGHAQAAGLTIAADNIGALRERLTKIAAETLAPEDYIPTVSIECAMSADEVDLDFIETLNRLEPYGMGNPKPVFACMNARLSELRTMGQDGAHLRFKAAQGDRVLSGLAWNMGQLAGALQKEGAVDIAFLPEVNEWQGARSAQIKAQDFRPHQKALTQLDRLYLAHADTSLYKHIESAEQFFSKAVGVTFENRQAAIADLTAGAPLTLKRQPENPHDANAILLCADGGREIGYIRAEIARYIAPAIDAGARYKAQATAITGGLRENEHMGVNILVYREQTPLFCARKYTKIDLDTARAALIGERPFHRCQSDALDSIAKGKNTLVIMGTGRGKSAIFQAHAAMLAINQGKMTVVVYPLRALVNDQYVNMRRMMEPLGVAVYKGNGTLSAGERGNLFEALQNGAADIFLTTPEFLEANFDLLNIAGRVGFVVVDECHHLAEQSRRPAYKRLGGAVARMGNPTALCVTATADRETCALICREMAIETTLIDPTIRENLCVADARDGFDKLLYLKSLLKKKEKTLIFVNSRAQAAEIARQLRETIADLSESVGFYHAGLSNEWRLQVENWFRDGTLTVVVATSAFGEGIDLPDIRHVVAYHLPFDRTSFNQQCGRAGRDGQKSLVHLLFGKDDSKLNQLILNERSPDRETIGKVYLTLKANQRPDGLVEMTNAQIAEAFIKRYGGYIGESGASSSLKILEELKLVARETFRAERKIYFLSAPEQKLDLTQSASFVEGVNEREAFGAFSQNALSLGPEAILSWINRPIYPAEQ